MSFIQKHHEDSTYLTTWLRHLKTHDIPWYGPGTDIINLERLLDLVGRERGVKPVEFVKHLTVPQLRKIIDHLQTAEKTYKIKITGNPETLWKEWYGLVAYDKPNATISDVLDGKVGSTARQQHSNALSALINLYLRIPLEEITERWPDVNKNRLENARKGRNVPTLEEHNTYLGCMTDFISPPRQHGEDKEASLFLLKTLNKNGKKLALLRKKAVEEHSLGGRSIEQIIKNGSGHEKLHAVRAYIGWNVEEVSNTMRVPRNTYSKYEYGALRLTPYIASVIGTGREKFIAEARKHSSTDPIGNSKRVDIGLGGISYSRSGKDAQKRWHHHSLKFLIKILNQ